MEILSYHKFPLRGASGKLYKALEDRLADDKNSAKRQKMDFQSQSPQCPSAVLAFDEAHTITGVGPSEDGSWSRFSELCHAIRTLQHESLFTLFIPTSTIVFLVIPNLKRDRSSGGIHPRDMISQVTSKEHLAAYG